MGQVSSSVSRGAPFCVQPHRLAVQKFQCFIDEPSLNSEVHVVTATYDQLSEKYIASRPDKRPLGFTCDPETQQLLLQVEYSSAITLVFTIAVSVLAGTGPDRLVFVSAKSSAELDAKVASSSSWTDVAAWPLLDEPVSESLEFVHTVGPSPGQPLHFAFFFASNPEAVLSGGGIWVCESSVPGESSPGSSPKPSPKESSPTPTPIPSTVASAVPATAPGSSQQLPYGMPLAPVRDPTLYMAPRPSSSHTFESEDGPLFRSAIASMEKLIPPLKARVKQLLKRSMASHERLQALIEADQLLAQSLQEGAKAELPSFKPLAEWFSQKHEGGMSAIQRQRKVSLNELATRVIEPLQQLYEYDIKSFEQRKRTFEELSSQFYSWTSRYLSNRKDGRKTKTGESMETKFAAKKKAFDAARFEYFSYLTDISSGLKQQIMLQLLALAAQSLTDSHIALGSEMDSRTRPRIDAVVEDIKKAAKEWENYRLDAIARKKQLVDTSGSSLIAPTGTNGSATAPGSSETTEVPRNYKEGLLWASSRPLNVQDPGNNKQTLQPVKWHKYWVVLDGSSLREYANWKQSVDLHNEPINLLLASVREARNSDRRFCFEVVTPSYKRIYQATCEEDMRSWIAAISQSMSNLLENSEDQHPLSPLREEGEFLSLLGGGGGSTGQLLPNSQHPQPQQQPQQQPQHQQHAAPMAGTPQLQPSQISSQASSPSVQSGTPPVSAPVPHTPLSSPTSPGPAHYRPTLLAKQGSHRIESLTRRLSMKNDHKPRVPPIITTLSGMSHAMSPSAQSARPSTNLLTHNDELLTLIHREPSNQVCAECQTTNGVEWVSINLLIVMCIDCSGAHRSLGSHISKVRSLTLDVGAFTPSLRAALFAVSNASMNSIWEARIPPNRKLTPEANGKARVKFATEKYVEKQFILELEKPNAVLRRAISERDISKICAALASRANPNGMSDDNEPMIIHALRSALPGESCFASAEVLIKNGATVPPVGMYQGLSRAAEEYLAAKQSQP